MTDLLNVGENKWIHDRVNVKERGIEQMGEGEVNIRQDGNTILGQIKRGHSTVVERDKWIKKTEGLREREGKEKTGG